MFYNFPGAPGNTAYNAQANPNPLMARDPSFQVHMGNAGFFAGPQYAQQMPAGFQNKMVS